MVLLEKHYCATPFIEKPVVLWASVYALSRGKHAMVSYEPDKDINTSGT